MTVGELLIQVNTFAFITLGLLTTLQYLRDRSRTRLDIALMFGALLISVSTGLVNRVSSREIAWLNAVYGVALLAQPYLLLRLVQDFRPLAPRVLGLALAGMIGSWLVILVGSTALGLPLVLAVIFYFVFFEGYAAYSFVRGARAAGGVARRRLSLAAAGSGFLALALLIIGVDSAFKSFSLLVLDQTAGLLSGVCYYLGFATPRVLRRTWQLAELHRFLKNLAGKPVMERAKDVGRHLRQTAQQVAGGPGAVVLWRRDADDRLELLDTDELPTLPNMLLENEGVAYRAWRSRTPLFAEDPAEFSPDEQRLLALMQADTLLAVPIHTLENVWGVLIVFMRQRSLFLDDDLDLLALLAEQTAIFLQNAALIEQLRRYTGQLEQKVEERTAALRASEAELRALFGAMPDVIMVLDRPGRVVKLAPTSGGARLPQDLPGKSVYDLFPVEQADVFLRQIGQVFETGQVISTEFSYYHRDDGVTRWYALTLAPLLDDRVLWVARDMTERKIAEQTLAENEARFRQLTENIREVFWLRDLPSGRILYISSGYEDIWGVPPQSMYDDPRSFIEAVHPEDRPRIQQASATYAAGGFDEQYRIVRPDGSERWVLARTFPILNDAGEVYRVAGIAEDITERKRAEDAEREQRTLAEALRDTATALVSTLQLSEVLERILENVGEVVPHDAAEMLLIDAGEAHVVGCRGYSERGLEYQVTELRFSVAETPNLRWMAEHGQPLIITDTRLVPDWITVPEGEWLRSYCGVPIRWHDETLGFLNLFSVTPSFFTLAHADRLNTFAQQAALAIENARLYEQARALAAYEERQRLARDLHDAVSQTLFSASVVAEALPRLWGRDPDRVRQGLDELHHYTRGALAEMRTLLLELRPSALQEAELGDLLRLLVEAVQSRKRLDVSLVVDAPASPAPEVKTALYRIAQEALNNIIKHAQASEAALVLHCLPDRVELAIHDNGRGFDPSEIAPTSLGLGIMRERAEEIGAQIRIQSQVNQGTEIVVTWSSQIAGTVQPELTAN